MTEQTAELRRLYEALLNVAFMRQFGPCWCDTLARLYCVGQERCKQAQAALKPMVEDTAFLLAYHASLLNKDKRAAVAFAAQYVEKNPEFAQLSALALRLHEAMHRT